MAAGAGMDDHPFLALVLVLVMLYLIMWFAVRFWTAVAVSVVEDPGITAAIQRSWNLSEGVRMRIFLVLLVVGVLGYLVSIPVGFLIRPLSQDAAYAIELGLGALIAAFGSVVLSVGYHDLRQAQEGVATDELAAIFE